MLNWLLSELHGSLGKGASFGVPTKHYCMARYARFWVGKGERPSERRGGRGASGGGPRLEKLSPGVFASRRQTAGCPAHSSTTASRPAHRGTASRHWRADPGGALFAAPCINSACRSLSCSPTAFRSSPGAERAFGNSSSRSSLTW